MSVLLKVFDSVFLNSSVIKHIKVGVLVGREGRSGDRKWQIMTFKPSLFVDVDRPSGAEVENDLLGANNGITLSLRFGSRAYVE